MDACLSVKFAQESMRAAELALKPRQHEIWLRLALMWALAAAQCREAGAVGEDAAVYLSGDGPIAAQG